MVKVVRENNAQNLIKYELLLSKFFYENIDIFKKDSLLFFSNILQ